MSKSLFHTLGRNHVRKRYTDGSHIKHKKSVKDKCSSSLQNAGHPGPFWSVWVRKNIYFSHILQKTLNCSFARNRLQFKACWTEHCVGNFSVISCEKDKSRQNIKMESIHTDNDTIIMAIIFPVLIWLWKPDIRKAEWRKINAFKLRSRLKTMENILGQKNKII